VKVVNLFPNQSVSDGLRNIADEVDSGDLPDGGYNIKTPTVEGDAIRELTRIF